MSDETDRPEAGLRITRGHPTPEEVAAIIAVVSEAYAQEADSALAEDDVEASNWAAPRRNHRVPPTRGATWGRFGS